MDVVVQHGVTIPEGFALLEIQSVAMSKSISSGMLSVLVRAFGAKLFKMTLKLFCPQVVCVMSPENHCRVQF